MLLTHTLEIFFPKNRISSGRLHPLWVLFSKKVADNPFKVLWSAKQDSKKALFNKYYIPCHKKLTMYCLGMLKDIELAENAATDALLKLLQSEKNQNEIENPERWLFTVAKNSCLSLLSQKKRRREIIDQLKPRMETVAPARGDQKLQKEDLEKRIKNILNPKEWQIWRLHQEGYDNREIATQLEITEKTAANLKSIARNKLRKALRSQN